MTDADHTTPATQAVEETLFQATYIADRAHELEMQKFSGQLEFELLKGLFILHGGAAVAFVTYLKVAGGQSSAPRTPVELGLLAWLVGVFITGAAALNAYRGQRSFIDDVRLRRLSLTMRRLGRNAPEILGTLPEDTTEGLATRARAAQQTGTRTWQQAERLALISLGVFVLGAACAAWVVIGL